jgi:hypothetical protein
MLERVSERHGWWYTPPEEWLEKARSETDPERAAGYTSSADRNWAYYAGDQTLTHWTDEQYKHKLLAIQRGEPAVVGWDAQEREYWRCGDDLYRADAEGLEADAVAALIRGGAAVAPDSPLAEVPIVRDDVPFVVGDGHWRAAVDEYHAAATDEDRYVALVLANALLDDQAGRLHAINARIGARRFSDPERHLALAWVQTWSASVEDVRLPEPELLARIGRSRADALATQRIDPRLASLRRHAV